MIHKKNEEKKFIIFQPPDNEEVQNAVRNWLNEAGGSLSLKEVEKKFDKTFHFFYPQVYTEEQIAKYSIESWKKFVFRLKNNVVYNE